MVPAAAETRARKRRKESLKIASIVQRNNRYNVVYLYDDEATGHAQAQMVTDQYSHILDDDRKNNAALFERAFYSGKGVESVEAPAEPEDKGPAAPAGVDPELLAKILSNPEMAALLTSLAKSLN